MNKFLKTLSAIVLFAIITTAAYAVQLGQGLGEAATNGVLFLSEITTPTPIADSGAVYAKSDR